MILLDAGHARTTPGKRSPLFDDGKTQFFEYEFNRDIVGRIHAKLTAAGIESVILVPEVDYDVPLTERANRANKYGVKGNLFISIHANAAGRGEWMKARGWCVYTTKGVTKSDKIASVFWDEANKVFPQLGLTLRKDLSDGDTDIEANFTVIYKTKMPAILTENFFMDNKEDVAFLMTEYGRETIADVHVAAIKRCLNEKLV